MSCFLEVSGGGRSVRIEGIGRNPLTGLYDGIEGWWSTPQAKVESTERQGGHGAFPVEGSAVLYSSRTVTINLAAMGGGRDETVRNMERLNAMAGGIVRLRVCDGASDTFCEGYIDSIDWQPQRGRQASTGTLTVVCPDPRRYSTVAKEYAIAPGWSPGAGLMFDGSGCMEWPVSFYVGDASQASTSATLTNEGNATAYPVITVQGSFPYGVFIAHGQGSLVYSAPLSWQALELDCLSGTATIGGVDVTRNLTARDFPCVPPGGSVRMSLLSGGDGAMQVEVRDTYI